MNIIHATFGSTREAVTRAIHQYDYGQVLRFVGIALPSTYEVHFSNSKTGTARTVIGDENGVTIPEYYTQSGADIYAWVYLHTGQNDGETVYTVRIPVKSRAQPTDEEPTPVEQTAITQAIAALNAGVETVQEGVATVQSMIDGLTVADDNEY